MRTATVMSKRALAPSRITPSFLPKVDVRILQVLDRFDQNYETPPVDIDGI